jgi:hypothetical protein
MVCLNYNYAAYFTADGLLRPAQTVLRRETKVIQNVSTNCNVRSGCRAINTYAHVISRVQSPQCQLLGTVESRASMYRERLVLTQQRLLRSELFALKGMGNSTLTSKHSSSNGPVHEVCVYTVTSPARYFTAPTTPVCGT